MITCLFYSVSGVTVSFILVFLTFTFMLGVSQFNDDCLFYKALEKIIGVEFIIFGFCGVVAAISGIFLLAIKLM